MINKYAAIYLKEEQNKQEPINQAVPVETKKTKITLKKIHPDVQLLLNACTRLLYSSNPAIVLEVAHISVDFP